MDFVHKVDCAVVLAEFVFSIYKEHSISDRYIELFENITGEKFVKEDTSNIAERIEKNVMVQGSVRVLLRFQFRV